MQVDEVTAVNDFLARIAHYASAYEPLDEAKEGASTRPLARAVMFCLAGGACSKCDHCATEPELTRHVGSFSLMPSLSLCVIHVQATRPSSS